MRSRSCCRSTNCLRYDRIYGLIVAYEDLWVPWYSWYSGAEVCLSQSHRSGDLAVVGERGECSVELDRGGVAVQQVA